MRPTSRCTGRARAVAARRVPVQRLGELRPGAGGPAVLGRPQEHAGLHRHHRQQRDRAGGADCAAHQPDQRLDVAGHALPDPAALCHPADRQRPDLGVPLQLPVRLFEQDPVHRGTDQRSGQLGRQSQYGALRRHRALHLAHPALRHHPGACRPAGHPARALRAGLDRRRQCLASLLAHHPADAAPDHRHHPDPAHRLRFRGVRGDSRHHPGRAGRRHLGRGLVQLQDHLRAAQQFRHGLGVGLYPGA